MKHNHTAGRMSPVWPMWCVSDVRSDSKFQIQIYVSECKPIQDRQGDKHHGSTACQTIFRYSVKGILVQFCPISQTVCWRIDCRVWGGGVFFCWDGFSYGWNQTIWITFMFLLPNCLMQLLKAGWTLKVGWPEHWNINCSEQSFRRWSKRFLHY